MPDTPLARPGVIVYGADPEEVWRKGITGNTQDMKMLSLGGFALDRQLKLKAVPLDPKRAEPLMKVIRNLHARVFISADRTWICSRRPTNGAQIASGTAVRARAKVDILGPKDESIATIAASSLPAPSGR